MPFLHNYWIILASLLIALVLQTLPLPEWITAWRPAWVAMVLIYWNMALPHRVSIGTAWIVGLLLDVLQGTLLGQHAFGLAVIAFVTSKLYLQIRQYPLYQQSIYVGVMIMIYVCLVVWVNGIAGRPPASWIFLAPVLSSMLLWPWVFVVLRDIRRRAKVT